MMVLLLCVGTKEILLLCRAHKDGHYYFESITVWGTKKSTISVCGLQGTLLFYVGALIMCEVQKLALLVCEAQRGVFDCVVHCHYWGRIIIQSIWHYYFWGCCRSALLVNIFGE